MLHAAPGRLPGLMGNRSGSLNLRLVVAQHDHDVRRYNCGRFFFFFEVDVIKRGPSLTGNHNERIGYQNVIGSAKGGNHHVIGHFEHQATKRSHQMNWQQMRIFLKQRMLRYLVMLNVFWQIDLTRKSAVKRTNAEMIFQMVEIIHRSSISAQYCDLVYIVATVSNTSIVRPAYAIENAPILRLKQ